MACAADATLVWTVVGSVAGVAGVAVAVVGVRQARSGREPPAQAADDRVSVVPGGNDAAGAGGFAESWFLALSVHPTD